MRRKSGRRETVTALAGVRWYASRSTSVAFEIEHAGQCYLLRVTRENKLILTK